MLKIFILYNYILLISYFWKFYRTSYSMKLFSRLTAIIQTPKLQNELCYILWLKTEQSEFLCNSYFEMQKIQREAEKLLIRVPYILQIVYSRWWIRRIKQKAVRYQIESS